MTTVRERLRLIGVALATAALTLPLTGVASASTISSDRIPLPNGFRPEGIAIGPGRIAYLGSLANGDILRLNLRTGEEHVISQGPGTPSVGLKLDKRGRLFVAGGVSGGARVVSTRTGKILASYQFTDKPSFVNDVFLTRSIAWFTDSVQDQLYGVPRGRHGAPAAPSQVITLPLSGDWTQSPGVANGIESTPDRKNLLVVQSGTGFLFRVNPHTGVALQVDLGGTLLTKGDGLLRQGRTLFVVQNRLNKVSVLRLNRSGTKGVLVQELTSPDFDIPTTIAAVGNSLYIPQARFATPPTPDTEYWVTRIDRPGHHDDDD